MTIRDKALGLFKGPFTFNAFETTIVDANGTVVADVNGWGAVLKFSWDDRYNAQDALGELIAEAMTEKFNKEKEY